MSEALSVEFNMTFDRRGKAVRFVEAEEARPKASDEIGRVPRIARLLALAIRFERMVRTGEVKNYADLARLGRITRARMSQIMGLLNLAPDLQQEILELSRVTKGRASVILADVLPIAQEVDWRKQRRMWGHVTR
jgi:hypothetical protein